VSSRRGYRIFPSTVSTFHQMARCITIILTQPIVGTLSPSGASLAAINLASGNRYNLEERYHMIRAIYSVKLDEAVTFSGLLL
jgi:hypothetical protein